MNRLQQLMAEALEEVGKGEVSEEVWREMQRRQRFNQRSLKSRTMMGGPLYPAKFYPPGILYML